MFQKIGSVDGGIVECGVGYGKSFLILAWLIGSSGIRRSLWGFDSFAGFPEPDKLDNSSRHPKKGEWGRSSVGLIKRLLAGAGLEKDGVTLIKGFLDQSLPEYRKSLAPISLLHLDVDLYDSYKVALENLWEAVSPGGIVIFDEYRHPKWPGATIAIDDFFRDKEQDIIEDKRSHRHYVIKR